MISSIYIHTEDSGYLMTKLCTFRLPMYVTQSYRVPFLWNKVISKWFLWASWIYLLIYLAAIQNQSAIAFFQDY